MGALRANEGLRLIQSQAIMAMKSPYQFRAITNTIQFDTLVTDLDTRRAETP